MLPRYLEKFITQDLKEKMVFICGPRQVGKTTLALQVGGQFFPDQYAYLNWDNRQDRKAILQGQFAHDKKLYILDEIHKYRHWKNYLKGEYDKYKDRFKILVTGSARLDIYRRCGDSLLGRYRLYRLHPLSLAEFIPKKNLIKPFQELVFPKWNHQHKDIFQNLFTFGGFPQIFIKKDERSLRLWHNERTDRLIREDIRDIENLRDISALQILVEILPQKVGSLFSLNALREDFQVTHKTISLWTDVLERFYYHYRIYPFQSTQIRSLRKEPKLYLWDWSEIEDEAVKLENMVASHLLKFCHFLYDGEGYKAELNFLRDQEQREVDFLVSINRKPWFCVEVKKSFQDIPSSLKYFGRKLKIPHPYLVVHEEGVDFIQDHVCVISASKFLGGLV